MNNYSPYSSVADAPEDAVQAALDALAENNPDQARQALEYALLTLTMNYKHALKSQLVRLMMHIIKWHIQPQKRSGSWAGSIVNARMEIEQIQEEKPSLNRAFLDSIWEQCLRNALRQASAETGIMIEQYDLTWHDVFETEYRLNDHH